MSAIPYPNALSQVFQRLIGHKKEEDAFWYCYNCGNRNPKSVKVCRKCGQKLLVKLSVEPISTEHRQEKRSS